MSVQFLIVSSIYWHHHMVQFVVQVMRKSHEARQKLLRLGIFRKVEVVIDTSRGTVSHSIVLMLYICTFE